MMKAKTVFDVVSPDIDGEELNEHYIKYARKVACCSANVLSNAACEYAGVADAEPFSEISASALYATILSCEACLALFPEGVKEAAFASVKGNRECLELEGRSEEDDEDEEEPKDALYGLFKEIFGRD